MNSHSKAKHHLGHRVISFSFRGKRDSVDATCECGFSAIIAVWYEHAPPGWDTKQWPHLIVSIREFLDSWYPEE